MKERKNCREIKNQKKIIEKKPTPDTVPSEIKLARNRMKCTSRIFRSRMVDMCVCAFVYAIIFLKFYGIHEKKKTTIQRIWKRMK